MPVQRVPRYEMLLRELLRLSLPDVFAEEYASLSKALEAIMDVACHINNHVRLAEHAHHMSHIQSRLTGRNIPHLIAPGRLFIKEGLLKKVIEIMHLRDCNKTQIHRLSYCRCRNDMDLLMTAYSFYFLTF